MPPRTLKVEKRDAGTRLDRFLSKALSGLSLDKVQSLARAGHIRIRGKAASPERKLWGNEEIELDLPDPPRTYAASDAPAVPVLYQDPRLVVVDKPAGLVVEPSGDWRSVAEIVSAQLGGCSVAGTSLPGVAHRLDRETSGCLALARSDEALAELKASFESKRVEKRYLALVLGTPPDTQRLEGPYGRDPSDPRRFTTRVRSARRAALALQVRERFPDAALVEVSLETGRTHQIRVQLSEAGFPVLADPLYGSPESQAHPASRAIGRQALHAFHLRLPSGGQPIAVEAPLPSDLARALAVLRGG